MLYPLSLTAALVAIAAPPANADAGPPTACDRPYIQAHLALVEAELQAADTGHLAPTQRARRAELVSALADYRARCVFPTHTLAADRIVTVFVDDDGVHCAVGHLMALTGAGDVVTRIRATANTATVQELADDPAFQAWLDAHGLTAAEAARIQPGYCGMNRGGTCLCGGYGAPPASGVAEARITALPDGDDAWLVEARVTRVHGTGASVDDVRMVHRIAGDVVGRDILIVLRDGDVPNEASPRGRGPDVLGDGHVTCTSGQSPEPYYCAHVPSDVYVAALLSEDCLSALGAHDPDLRQSACDLGGGACRADGTPPARSGGCGGGAAGGWLAVLAALACMRVARCRGWRKPTCG